jgi:hypothetical protein
MHDHPDTPQAAAFMAVTAVLQQQLQGENGRA